MRALPRCSSGPPGGEGAQALSRPEPALHYLGEKCERNVKEASSPGRPEGGEGGGEGGGACPHR